VQIKLPGILVCSKRRNAKQLQGIWFALQQLICVVPCKPNFGLQGTAPGANQIAWHFGLQQTAGMQSNCKAFGLRCSG
jgi:hypothetical protein